MLPKTRQRAWIRGLPGLEKEGGIPFETLPISLPLSDQRFLRVTIFASGELVSRLQSLVKQHITLPAVSLTIRTDALKELDNQLQMTDVMIDSIAPLEDLPGAQVVTMRMSSIFAKMALTANPGPPQGAPTVHETGCNLGWIYTSSKPSHESGLPIEILDFASPDFDGRLAVTLARPFRNIAGLVKTSPPDRELILVLPDRTTQCYIEFKLRDAKTAMSKDAMHITFEADVIECLTGEDH